MEDYLYQLPCGCTSRETRRNQFDGKSFVHSSLPEYLSLSPVNLRLNPLDEKRRKKVLLHLESLQNWISKEIEFDETRTFQTIKELNKIARVLQQMAFDVIRQTLVDLGNICWPLGSTVVARRLSLDDLRRQTRGLCASSSRRSSLQSMSRRTRSSQRSRSNTLSASKRSVS